MNSNVEVAPRLVAGDPNERINWQLSVPFFVMHLLPLGALWFHPTLVDWLVCFGLYGARMFFITGVYHRYFAHRGYKAGRLVTFLLAFGGGTAAQKGALWWASHHRWHHRFSDTDRDPHQSSRGFWWSHVLWILLNKHHLIPPVVLGFVVWLVGGWSMLFTGFFLSTVLLYHGTFSINSLTHRFGR